jgi:hypothetical protein
VEELRKTTKYTQEKCDPTEVLIRSVAPVVRRVHRWDIALILPQNDTYLCNPVSARYLCFYLSVSFRVRYDACRLKTEVGVIVILC